MIRICRELSDIRRLSFYFLQPTVVCHFLIILPWPIKNGTKFECIFGAEIRAAKCEGPLWAFTCCGVFCETDSGCIFEAAMWCLYTTHGMATAMCSHCEIGRLRVNAWVLIAMWRKRFHGHPVGETALFWWGSTNAVALPMALSTTCSLCVAMYTNVKGRSVRGMIQR